MSNVASKIPSTGSESAVEKPLNSQNSQAPLNAAAIRAWLVDYLAQLLQMDAADIAENDVLGSYGLDSSGAVGMTGDLGAWLGFKLDPDLVYRHPTIAALAEYVVQQKTASK